MPVSEMQIQKAGLTHSEPEPELQVTKPRWAAEFLVLEQLIRIS